MRKTIVLVLFSLFVAVAGWGQKLESQPGYVPLQELGFPRDKLQVEINIGAPLLRMIAAGAKQDDPGFSSVLAGLQSIQVQVFPMKEGEVGAVKTRIDRAVHWLESRGWQSTVRVRDQGQEKIGRASCRERV